MYSMFETVAVKNFTLSGNITLGEEGKVGAYQSKEVLKAKTTAWI